MPDGNTQQTNRKDRDEKDPLLMVIAVVKYVDMEAAREERSGKTQGTVDK